MAVVTIRDTFDVCMEELTFSGLEGAPPELLWIRLQQRLEALVLTDMYKQCLWQHFVLLSRSERGSKVTFFTTPNPLAINNVFQDSHWHNDVTSHKQRLYIPPPNSWRMVKDDKLNIWGTCSQYKERNSVTELIRDSNCSYADAIDRFGDKLVLVASQALREYHLTPPMTDPGWIKWTPKDYSVLELVAKSRNFGIMRHILNTSFAAEHKGTKAFHIIKSLKKLGFLLLEEVNYMNEGHLINATLIRLVKYENIPSATNLFQSKDKLGILHFLDGIEGKSATRKVLKSKYGTDVLDNLLSKGVISRISEGDRLRYKLVTPVSEVPEELLENVSSGDEYSSDDKEDTEDIRPNRMINYHRDSTLFLQCYKAIHAAGPDGVHLQDVIRSLPLNHLISRRVPISLEDAGLVVSKLEDQQHHKSKKLIRKFRLIASCYLKEGRTKNLDFNTHKTKQPTQKKTTRQQPPNQSGSLEFSQNAGPLSPSLHQPTHSRASLPTESLQPSGHIPSDTPENSRQSWVSEEQNEDLQEDLQEESSMSDYSDSEPIETPVVPLDQLREERGGMLFTEEEISEFLQLLSDRFNFTDMEVKLSYVDPEKQARKLSCTQLYERRKSDVLEYLQQKRVVIDLVGLKYFLHDRDSTAGVKYKLDTRTLYRFLSQLQIEGYIHQLLLEVTSAGRAREGKVYLYFGESLTSLRMLNKCEGLLIRLTDKISWKGRDIQPSQSPATNRFLNPAMPKFQKLRALHIYLYLLANGPDMEFDKIKELPYSWLSRVQQLPDTEDHGPGWINAAIALRCIPFSLFYALNALAREYQELLTDPIRDILSDPAKRDLPKARINIDKLGSELIRLKRHYSTRYRDMLIQLYEIGAIEVDGYTKPGINRVISLHMNLETVYLYIKPTLRLIDTSREAPGSRHSFFCNEAREYLPTYSIQLDTVADLDYYWLMANIISNNSKIVIQIESRKRKRKQEEFSLPIERDGKIDFKKLDSVGFSAAGFPPSLHSNHKRNWSGICEPIDPAICHFNFQCHSLAYKATNIFSLETKKMSSQHSSMIPHPKVLVSQKTVLMKLRTRGKSLTKRKKSVGKKVPFFSCNMVSFVRANFRAPEEAGLMRKPLTRCSHWSREESNKLLLCYIASVTLIKLLGKQVPTMVCIMSVLEETSRDKTTSVIRRHLRGLMKKTPMLFTYCDNSIRDLYNALKTEDLDELTFESVYIFTKDTLSDSPAAVMRGEVTQETFLLPSSVEEMLEKYRINKPNNFGFNPKVETETHTSEDSIKVFMLQDMILSTLSLYAGTNFESYTVYLMYNKFSSSLLKQVVATLKHNYVLGRNKEEGSGDMRYKIKYLTQSRLSDSYPPSCVLEPQLIPYSLSDIPMYSHDSDSLVTTLTEEFMLASTADLYSFFKHLYSHPNNFRMEIELPYNACKTGEHAAPQYPLYILDRSAGSKADAEECISDLRNPSIEMEPEREQETEGKKDQLSISKYFGVDKTHVMKCADIVTLAVSDPWSTAEFETRGLPPYFPSYPLPEQAADSTAGMSWEEYARLVIEHCSYSTEDIEISKCLFEDISEQKVIGARELYLINEYSSSRKESQFSIEVLVQNLVNFEMVMRAGTTEPCLVARHYSEMWQHPIIGLDSLKSVDNARSTLTNECVTCFRPWIGLLSSGLVWNTVMLNQLTRSIHCYVVMNTGVSEVALLHYFNGFCQLRHIRDILQTLVDSGFVRRILLEAIGGEAIERKKKSTLLSSPQLYKLRQIREMSNRDPACIFYEGIPGKDISGSELMLEQKQATN